jgi:nicotinamidase-related amidase
MRSAKPALLVIDVQAFVVNRVGADESCLHAITTVVDGARRAGVPVIYVVVGFRPGHPEVSERNRLFSALKADGRFLAEAPESALHESLEVQPGDLVVTKRRISAFSGSDLEVILRASGIDHLVVAGIATSGTVLSTTFEAADRDYRVTVLRDACADGDAEVHRVLLDKVFPRCATVATGQEWLASLT